LRFTDMLIFALILSPAFYRCTMSFESPIISFNNAKSLSKADS
jgi:hypothetical protein